VGDPRPDATGKQGKGLQVYGGSAYGTGAARAAYRAGGHDTVIKPKTLRFDMAERAGTVTCPAGHTRPMSTKRTVTFGKLCANCPLRARCTPPPTAGR
jgi:hypothetical protein